MDEDSLVIDQIEAGAEFVNLFDKQVPVTAAFWAKPADAGQWYLYIASEQIDDEGIGRAYREVLRLAKLHRRSYLDPFQVRLIPAKDPLAQAVLEIHRWSPGKMATRIGNKAFGGMSVEGVYIYPPLVVAPTP
ncbi:hypothetical protein ACYOEI_41175 [Singulisphaera rosea]